MTFNVTMQVALGGIAAAALSMSIVYAIICEENVPFGAYYADRLIIISPLYKHYAKGVSIQVYYNTI